MTLNLQLATHFNASVTFLLLVLENLKKYHKGDSAGHCPTYIYIYIQNINVIGFLLKWGTASRKFASM